MPTPVQYRAKLCRECAKSSDADARRLILSNGTRPSADDATDELREAFKDFSYGPGEAKVRVAVNKAANKKHVEVEFDGYIGGYDGIQAKQFKTDVKRAVDRSKAKVVRVIINSGGGDVFEADAIFNTLDALDVEVHTHIVGVAASAATFVSQAADPGHRTIAKNAKFMIHGARGITWGTRDDIQSYLELLDTANDALVEVYSENNTAGKSQDDIRQLISRDRWMSAVKAKKLGFVDEVTSHHKVKPHVAPNSAIQGMGVAAAAYSPRRIAAIAKRLSSKRGTADESSKEKGTMKKFQKWLKAKGYKLAELSENMLTALRSVFEAEHDADLENEWDDILEAAADEGDDDEQDDDESEEEEEEDDDSENDSDDEGEEEEESEDDDEPAPPKSKVRSKKRRSDRGGSLRIDHSQTINRLEREETVLEMCGDNRKLAIKALKSNWSDTKIELELLKAEKAAAQKRAKAKKAGNFGTFEPFNVASRSSSTMKKSKRILEAATALSVAETHGGLSEDDLLEPFGKIKSRTASSLGFDTNVKGFTEQELEMAQSVFPCMDMKTLILQSNQATDTDHSQTWRGDSSIEASYHGAHNGSHAPQAATSTAWVPEIIRTTVQRLMIANYRKKSPMWKRFCGKKSVPNFKNHSEYRVLAQVVGNAVQEGGRVTEGNVELDIKNEYRVQTEGQYLMISREDIENGDLGPIRGIAESFILYGNYAPEFAAWQQAGKTLITPSATAFDFDFASLENLWKAWCRKTQFDPDSPQKDRVRGLAMEIDQTPAILIGHKVRKFDLRKLMTGSTVVTDGQGALTETVTRNVFENEFELLTSSYVLNEDGIAMIPNPASAPVIKVVLLRNREVPFVRNVTCAPNQIPGYGTLGYIDVAAQDVKSEQFLIATAADI